MVEKKLILIELNEINFDFAASYIKTGAALPAFEKIIGSENFRLTESETQYTHLEPWIQWPSVHLGKSFMEHKIFRLGDIVFSKDEQIFEKLERFGFDVGAVSPMNASNNLKKPAYFIPDPWTKTDSDGTFFSKNITAAISQAVNDNSQSKLTLSTLGSLILAFLALVSPSRYFSMTKYALGVFGRSWRKALFLDILLYEIHKKFLKNKKSNFSTLFLNAGAHIQHHYLFNSPHANSGAFKNPSWYINQHEDPVLEMLEVYDEMLLSLLSVPGTEIIIATGLSQKPYKHLLFYYRLKDHNKFLSALGIDFISVVPRMTRDFLISCSSKEKALKVQETLSAILVNNQIKLFEEIDNRGKDIFVVLTYPSEITNKTLITVDGKDINLKDLVTFVAIKNGEHQSKGFAYYSKGIVEWAPPQGSHVSEIHNTILQFFGIPE